MVPQIQPRRTTYPVKQFASWFKEKQITLRPPFQRNDVWKPTAKALLIDTVLRGLPMPIIILRDKAGYSLEPHQDVVDGQQRLTALLTFILPEYFDQDKRFTVKVDGGKGKSFDELDDEVKQRILDYEISVHVLPASVDDQQVLRIFARLNSTGLPLKNQELRNAEYQGEFKRFIYDLSLEHFDDWKYLDLFSEDDFARMKEVEFASDLVIRMLKGTTAASKRTIDKFYRDFDETFPDERLCKRRFDKVLGAIVKGLDTSKAPIFDQVTWFYTLFGDVHDRMYGCNRNSVPPFLVDEKLTSLPENYWTRLSEFSSKVKANEIGTVDEQKTVEGHSTNAKTRKILEEWMCDYFSSR